MEEDKQVMPILALKIDKEDKNSGMNCISFVQNPATQKNWNKFSQKKLISFREEGHRRIVTGPVMLADTSIFKYNDLIGAYYVQFSPEQLFIMTIKYFKEKKIHNVNLNHDSKKQVKNVTMFEYFLIDERGNKNEKFADLPFGSVMASFYVEDDNVWQMIINEEINGFSLEGFFDEELESLLVEKVLREKGNDLAFADELFYYRFKDLMFSDLNDDEKCDAIVKLFTKM